MSNLGREFLLLNFDGLSYPSIELKFTSCPQTENHRWGLAWYPGDGRIVTIAKDPASTQITPLAEMMASWEQFRSTIYTCRVIEASSGYTQDETQPFVRHFGDRDWMFMHQGSLDKTGFIDLFQDDPKSLRPFGRTDSELAFCYLLNKIKEDRKNTLFGISFDLVKTWLSDLDNLGSCNIFLSDGLTVLIYRGKKSDQPLFYKRFKPPSPIRKFETDGAKIEFNDPQDNFRTALAFCVHPLDPEEWTKIEPSQLLIARRGAIIWDSALSKADAFSLKPLAYKDKSPLVGPKSINNIRSILHTAEGKPLSYRSYAVKHITEYNYTQAVERSTHIFRLQPVEDGRQEIVHSAITISQPGEDVVYQDVFGNESIDYKIFDPYTKLKIESHCAIKIFATPDNNNAFQHRRSSIPLIWMPWQRQMMLAYLLPPELPESHLAELTAYAMSFVERNDYDLLGTVEDINNTIYRDYEYLPGSTSLMTTPFEVYANRKGVCQDFANLFICLARLLSIPARYRMGYIHTGTAYENKIQSDASHAWVELYLPYLGWRGFDPTNGCRADQDHIRVACGRNYIDATPTSGTIYASGGNESLSVQVEVHETYAEAESAIAT